MIQAARRSTAGKRRFETGTKDLGRCLILSIEHGLVVCTTDNDFQRFSGIKTENPLA
ncbi:MAG: hypothetical protein V3S41_08365 [Spirochaetia bacterium]